MSVPPRGEAPKRAAVDLDELADRRLSEISAADFLRALEQAEAAAGHPSPEEATLRDVLLGARAAFRLPAGALPEKKKVEREKWPLEKFAPEKLLEHFPEKKKVELEKQQLEGFPEKKKVELEKQPIEKQSVEVPPDVAGGIGSVSDRLSAIEEQLARLAR